MLILYQNGETAVFLTEPFKIEIDHPITVLGSIYEKPPKVVSWDVVLSQGDGKEILGTYDTLEEAKQTIQRFTKAYERGDLAFRVE